MELNGNLIRKKTLSGSINMSSGSGAVFSVNGHTGAVVLGAEDVGAYALPSGGIPKTDLASAVQTSLDKADTIGITPEAYGAKGDGTTDDTSAIQSAFDAATLAGVPVTFGSGKTYAVSSTVSVIGRIPVFGHGATLKAISGGSFTKGVLRVVSRQSQAQFPGSLGLGVLEDITIDAQNIAAICLYTDYVQGGYFQNIDVCNFTASGVYIDHGYEMFFSGIRVGGAVDTAAHITSSASAIGIDVETNDCHFEDIVTRDVGIGVKVNGGNNFFSRVHSWNSVADIAQIGVMFDVYGPIVMSDLYADTVAKAIYLHDTYAVELYGMYVLYGGTTLMGSVVPEVFSLANYWNANRTKGYGVIVDKGAAADFKLFSDDVSGEVTFGWRENNDISITWLTNCPPAQYQGLISASGILKGNGSGGVSAAVAGTDYATPDLGITGASVGQYVKIKTVDGSGKPTEFEPGTPSGGGADVPLSVVSGKICITYEVST